MNGVKFGYKHSIKDWDLLMVDKDIGEPNVMTNYLQIPGLDGELDLTESLGDVKYSNRQLTFKFDMFQHSSKWWKLKSDISNYLHGIKHRIVLDVDSDYYYLGRCEVAEFTHDTAVAHITINCKCDPYKYKYSVTKKVFNVTAEQRNKRLAVYNEKRKVVPVITVDKNINLKFENHIYSLSEGDNMNLGILLKEGENIFEVIDCPSSGVAITFSYQEASF